MDRPALAGPGHNSTESALASSRKGKRPRKPPRLVDWRFAARLMADGQPPRVIAGALGITIDHFWAHLTRSPRFQRRIVEAIEARREKLKRTLTNANEVETNAGEPK